MPPASLVAWTEYLGLVLGIAAAVVALFRGSQYLNARTNQLRPADDREAGKARASPV
jgi:hypothetical protein